MTVDRSLTPDDAAVAVRSFPRRFRAVFARPDDADESFDLDEAARRTGSDGQSAVDHLVAATRLVDALPALGTDEGADDGSDLTSLLDRFERAADHATPRIEAVANDRWEAELPALQEAIAAIAAHLRAATNQVQAPRQNG